MSDRICFSCEKDPMKYIDGLCESCHRIAIKATDESDREVLKVTPHELLAKRGGDWLGAVRSYVQRKFRNGNDVTWGSLDVLEPHVTIRQMEEAASEAAAAAFNEQGDLKKQLDELRQKYLKCQIDLDFARAQLAKEKKG